MTHNSKTATYFDPILGKLRESESASVVENSLPVTYTQLTEQLTNGCLTPGTYYRITDYVTTVNPDSDLARSAMHPFDLIVLALTKNTLSHQAYAIQHDGDTYFAYSRLDQWQVWYDIHNDATRYEWVDEDNGKGVIYRLIDEYNNERNYDFKNIQFRRYLINGVSHENKAGETIEPSTSECELYGQYVGIIIRNQGQEFSIRDADIAKEMVETETDTTDTSHSGGIAIKDTIPVWLPEYYFIDETDYMYFYAFSAITENGIEDASLNHSSVICINNTKSADAEPMGIMSQLG